MSTEIPTNYESDSDLMIDETVNDKAEKLEEIEIKTELTNNSTKDRVNREIKNELSDPQAINSFAAEQFTSPCKFKVGQ